MLIHKPKEISWTVGAGIPEVIIPVFLDVMTDEVRLG